MHTTIKFKQLDYDLTATAGLALVGRLLEPIAPVLAKLDAALPMRSGVPSSDIVRSYLGLLVQGKSDFDAIENVRGDAFYKRALGIGLLPSCSTLRQRMDAHAEQLARCVPAMIEALLRRQAAQYGTLPCGWLPLDIDTFAMDNSGTAKEGVGRTYAGVDGFCPLAAYLGSNGYCVELSLRPGVQHSTNGTEEDLGRIVPLAQRLSAAGPKAPLLTRMDSGFCSAHVMVKLEAMNIPGLPQVDWIIKWNPRKTDLAEMAAQLDAEGKVKWQHPRHGKRQACWEERVQVAGIERPVRRVLRLVERTIGSAGQHLILPEYELDGWTTTLPRRIGKNQIIELYADHGTHEQFHAEFKTDLDLTRLPSGKFDTNFLVCRLAALAMNLLRVLGQSGLLGEDAPVRHPAKRRRLKTVIQELICRAGRIIHTARSFMVGLGRGDRAAKAFIRLHEQFAAAT